MYIWKKAIDVGLLTLLENVAECSPEVKFGTIYKDAPPRRSHAQVAGDCLQTVKRIHRKVDTARLHNHSKPRGPKLIIMRKKNRVMNGEISVRNGKCGVWCENGSNCVTVTLKAWGLAALCYVMLWPSWLLHIENNLGMRTSPNIVGYFAHCHLNI